MDINLNTKLAGIENVFMHYIIHWYTIYLVEGIEDQSEDIKDSIASYRKDVDSVKTCISEARIKSDVNKDEIATHQLLYYHNGWTKS